MLLWRKKAGNFGFWFNCKSVVSCKFNLVCNNAEACPGFHIPFLVGGGGQKKFLGGRTKVRLVLESVPYAPHNRFFHQGQNYTIMIFIRGICPICPTALHASAIMKKLNYQMLVRSYSYISLYKMYSRLLGA